MTYYHEYHEYSYHRILAGFFCGVGYRVRSERESGYGRSDLMVCDFGRSRGLVLELKHVKESSEMEAALHEASSQIVITKYDRLLKYEGYTERVRYAMAFRGKRELISEVTYD